MDEPILDDYEKELVRWLAQKYLDREGNLVNVITFPRFQEIGQERAFAARKVLTDAVLIKGVGSWEIEVLPSSVALVKQWDNPPPEPLPDYRDKLSKWFWSKPWSVPVLVVLVGLPAIVTWIGMVKTVLEWTGIIKGSSPK
ncbi:MAG: hypothetical protein ACLP9L_40890 [Thermoguttaceae bacterium]